MIDFSYDTIYGWYTGFFNELYLQDATNFIKVLAIAFFLLNLYSNIFSKMNQKFGVGNASLPFDSNKLLQSLLMVLILAFYDKLLNFLDVILMGIDASYSHFSPIDFVPPEEEVDGIDLDLNAFSTLKQMASEVLRIIDNPSYLLVLTLEGIAWIIDAAIYGVFLLERFFFIGLLKILGPIAILMSIFEKLRELFIKWLKLYVAVYLLIIPFFLVIGFASYIYNQVDGQLIDSSYDILFFGTSTRVIILTILIWLKLRLFKKSYEIVYKLF